MEDILQLVAFKRLNGALFNVSPKKKSSKVQCLTSCLHPEYESDTVRPHLQSLTHAESSGFCTGSWTQETGKLISQDFRHRNCSRCSYGLPSFAKRSISPENKHHARLLVSETQATSYSCHRCCRSYVHLTYTVIYQTLHGSAIIKSSSGAVIMCSADVAGYLLCTTCRRECFITMQSRSLAACSTSGSTFGNLRRFHSCFQVRHCATLSCATFRGAYGVILLGLWIPRTKEGKCVRVH